jgi:hypothetical protein
MKRLLICAVLANVLPTGVIAQTYERCTKAERGQFIAAAQRSERLALTAATAIGPNPSFTRWFGRYNAKSGEVVRRNLKAVVKALRSEKVTAVCHNTGEDLCDGDTFAFVDKDVPYRVHVCPTFFVMDTMKDLTFDSVTEGNGTRAGTLIHEVSHFTVVADTEDICYSRGDCTEMALDDPLGTLINADSYQYFAEDVTFFGVAGESATR